MDQGLVSIVALLVVAWPAITALAQANKGREWYLSTAGVDSQDCGFEVYFPCHSLAFLLTKVQGYALINILGSKEESFSNCISENLVLSHDVVIRGTNGHAQIGCISPPVSQLNITTTKRNITLMLQNVTLRNVNLNIHNINVRITDSVLTHSKTVIMGRQNNVTTFIDNCRLLGETDCTTSDNCAQTNKVTVIGYVAKCHFKNSALFHTKVEMKIMMTSEIIVESITQSNYPQLKSILSGIQIKLNKDGINSIIIIRNCVFKNQFHWNPIQSVMNLFEAAILLRIKLLNKLAITNIKVLVDNSTFYNNERGITVQGPFDNITISNSQFIQNIAMHAGAAILLLTGKDKLLQVNNCTFDSNAAGQFRTQNVSGDEVTINSECCKGSISLIGKGGALRVQKGYVRLVDSQFRNNTARLLGGAIFVDREGTLDVLDTKFSNTDSHHHSTQGDILYSNGNVTVDGGKLFVKTSSNHISSLQHSGEHWSLTITNLSLHCPLGHRLRVMNTSAYAVKSRVGLQRSYKLDQLSYFCESCPRNKYSTDYGFLRYELEDQRLGYFTLMINGETPDGSFQGVYEQHDITCLECPYGGVCEQNIYSLPNFWGYVHRKKISFSACPKGYCCTSPKCPTYNTCAPHRYGRLCASCRPGFSEALFSAKCVPDGQCGPIWIWIFFFGMGILYALLLLFQKDIRDFIFEVPRGYSWLERKSSTTADKTETQESQRIEMDKTTVEKSLTNSTMIQNNLVSPTRNGSARTITYDEEPDEQELLCLQVPAADERSTSMGNSSIYSGMQNESCDAPPPQQADTGATFLIILCYYFQDAKLFSVHTVTDINQSKIWGQIRAVLLGLFKFRIELSHFVNNVCLLEGLTPWQKELAKGILVPYVILIFGCLFALNWCRRLGKSSQQKLETDKFLVKLATGFQLCLLFTYQKLATTSFKLLNCVPIGDIYVLFIDGNVQCFSQWQWYVMAYAAACIVPFFIVLILGPGLLHEGLIGLPQFFMASLCPLPFLLYWLYLRITRKQARPEDVERSKTEQQQAVLKVLQGPFKEIDSKYFGKLSWSGILILRRLILVLFFTFLTNSLVRILFMIIVCFISLLHHIHVRPYKDKKGNMAGSASISALMISGGINLVRAAFESAEYTPHGPNMLLMKNLKLTEDTLMFWLPAAIMTIVFLALFAKLVLLVHQKCCKKSPNQQ